MILVDTTVLVQYLRVPSKDVRAILDSDAAICGVTRAEILHGARTPADAAGLVQALDGLIQIPIDEGTWDALGWNLSVLRARGIVTPFPDALIATVAIRAGLELWTYDAHFSAIQTALPALRLFAGPP
ncbi:MAG: PIN domain-containing protein [Pirellulales bacterium]